VRIRLATVDDLPAVVALARAVVEEGTSYQFAPGTRDDELSTFFFPPRAGALTFVAVDDQGVAGVYLLMPNGVGRAAHIANCAYVVARRAAGRGLGRRLCEHSLDEARRLGYRAMQFNYVVSTNDNAVALWKKLGFTVVGTIPQGFQHPDGRFVDAYVMHRFL
jgi:ribosomal protein S18 acetylase RimI-like enzyme